MAGIELSAITDDLVFDEKPSDKQKNSQTAAQRPASSQPQITEQPPVPVARPVLEQPQMPEARPVPVQSQASATRPATEQHRQTPKAKELELDSISPRAISPVEQSPSNATQTLSKGSSLILSETKQVRADSNPSQKKEALDLFESLLASAAKGGASDLLVKRGQVPMFRWNGELFPSRNGPRLEASFLETLASVLLSPANCQRLNDLHDVDFSYQSHRAGRIRVNMFHQCGEIGLVARLIPNEIPTFENLDMDLSLRQLVDHKRGLVLVTGATGSGKSTTLAALLDYINNSRTAHIITIEDPIEFLHHDKRSMFNQRELGLDTRGYASALRSALRQAPDVILVGELRDAETLEVALQAAETGHLVLSTLHTNDAADAILRMLGLTGQDKEAVVRAQLGDCLRGIISQRLVKRADRKGRIAAQEVMINTATIRERLLKGAHPSVVRDFIAQGANHGMQTFDQHLIQLVMSGLVDYDEGLRNASNRDDFMLRFNGVSNGREAS